MMAVPPPPAFAAVYSAQQALPAQVIKDFLADPGGLLTQHPNGGAQFISRVRDLAASDPATLNPLIALLGRANPSQSSGIGTGLGQAALMAVKTDQAYANEIQQAIATADASRGAPGGGGPIANGGSNQPHIGNAVATKDQVEGVTERGVQAITTGGVIYLNELIRTGDAGGAQLLFSDRTNVTVGPATEIRVDKFVYDPAQAGILQLNATRGTFRFITGVQPSKVYTIKLPGATVAVHGTEFYVVVTPTGLQIQLVSGELTITTSSGQNVELTAPDTFVSIDSQGNVQGPTAAAQPIVNVADLGAPITTLTLADALSAFSAVTGNIATAATGAGAGGGDGGGGTGGGGGSVIAFTGGQLGGGATTPTFSTFVVTTPTNFFTLSFTSSASTPGTTTTSTTTTTVTSVSPH
jgi:hypothetical protein